MRVVWLEGEIMSTEDWAAKAARRIKQGIDAQVANHTYLQEERIAAVIATFAEPLVKLLRESRREHSRTYLDEMNDYPPCPLSDVDAIGDEKCTCGADAFNAKIDAVLAGDR